MFSSDIFAFSILSTSAQPIPPPARFYALAALYGIADLFITSSFECALSITAISVSTHPFKQPRNRSVFLRYIRSCTAKYFCRFSSKLCRVPFCSEIKSPQCMHQQVQKGNRRHDRYICLHRHNKV